MLARRKSFIKYDEESKDEGEGSTIPSAPTPEIAEKLKETAKAFGLDTSGRVRREAKEESVESVDSVEITFYKMAMKNLGQDAINVIEGFLVVTALGALSLILAIGTGVAFVAYYKATGKPVPDQLDTFTASGEPVFTPLFGAFLSCTTIFGLWSFAKYDYEESEQKKADEN